MRESIPRLREAIKEASMVELKDFLETIRKFSPKIGELAMRGAAQRLKLAEAPPSADEPRYGIYSLLKQIIISRK